MRSTADVVIVGAGAIGVSVAYHLAKAGCRRVLVCDKGEIGMGSTALCAGGVRQQFATEAEVRFSRYSLDFFLGFADEVGVSADFHQIGYLILLSTERQVEAARRDVALQRSLGVPVELVDREGARLRNPYLYLDDVQAATWCPTDGHAGPHEVVQGLARRARERGVEIREGSPVEEIVMEAGRVAGVRTAEGTVSAPVVVNATGPYARATAAWAGVSIPVMPARRHIVVTEAFPAIRAPLPMTIDDHLAFYCRKEGEGMLFSGCEVDEANDYDLTQRPERIEQAVEKAVYRFPVMEAARVQTTWAGLREVTPDSRAIIGWAPGVEGLVLANGFSGHGFMHSPAAGKAVAELILHGRSEVDLSVFDPGRFARPPAG